MSRALWVGILIFVLILIIAGGAFFWMLSMQPLAATPAAEPSVSTAASSTTLVAPPPAATYTPPPSIATDHTRSGKTDTYSGALILPACQQISSGLSIAGSPPKIIISLRVFAQQNCTASGSAAQPFSVSFTPNSTTSIPLGSLLINGASAPFVLSDK